MASVRVVTMNVTAGREKTVSGRSRAMLNERASREEVEEFIRFLFLGCGSEALEIVRSDSGFIMLAIGLIRICFWARPPLLDAARVRENCFSLSFIAN
jgi:hypothetical protein